jgi:flagellar hook-associated protein 3 FlgL
MSTATQQLASGRSVNQLSDNPAAVAELVGNHNQVGQDDQFLQNPGTLQTRLQVSDSTLSSAADRQAVAGEVKGLSSQLLSLANTTYQGTYIFSGTAVTTQPFILNAATNAVTYNGNTNTTSVKISSGNSINSSVPGSQLFTNAAGDAFGGLQNLYASLISGTNIGQAVTQVNSALTQLGVQRVAYGNALNQMTSARIFSTRTRSTSALRKIHSSAVNPAKAATDFSQAQLANQSTLSATSRVLSLPTLLDFIK